MIGAVESALAGLALHQQMLNGAADGISRAGTWRPNSHRPPPDLASDLVTLRIAKYGYQANLATLRTVDEMLGTLLDVMA